MSLYALTQVFYHSNADGSARLVLLAIADCADDEGIAWPSLPTLAVKAHVSKNTARRKIEELIQLGELEILQKGDGRQATRYGVIFRQGGTIRRDTKMVPLKKSSIEGYQNETPGVPQLCHPRDTRAMVPELPNNYKKTKEPPSIPLVGKNKFSSPHSQVAAVAAKLNAPTPSPSAPPLGLEGAFAPCVAMSENRVSNSECPSSDPTTPFPVVHDVTKMANGKKNSEDLALIARFNAILSRPAHYPLTLADTRPLRHLVGIHETDLRLLEDVASDAQAQEWFPRTPRFLFRHWSSIINEVRKFKQKKQPVLPMKIPEWQSCLDNLKRVIQAPTFPNIDNIDKIMCGYWLSEIPQNTLANLLASLPPEQVNFLTDLKAEHARKLCQQKSEKENHPNLQR